MPGRLLEGLRSSCACRAQELFSWNALHEESFVLVPPCCTPLLECSLSAVNVKTLFQGVPSGTRINRYESTPGSDSKKARRWELRSAQRVLSAEEASLQICTREIRSRC